MKVNKWNSIAYEFILSMLFMFASSLQNEAKKKSTFPTALVSGLVVISVLYLFVAIGTMATATLPPAFTHANLLDVGFDGVIESTDGR